MRFHPITEGSSIVIRLEGDIDDGLRDQIAAIDAAITTPEVVFDCAKIKDINSLGVKHWLTLMGQLKNRVRPRFRHCPMAFTSMAAMVGGVLGNGKVESLLLRYECDSCGKTADLFTLTAQVADHSVPETMPCTFCKKTMSLDESILDGLGFLIE